MNPSQNPRCRDSGSYFFRPKFLSWGVPFSGSPLVFPRGFAAALLVLVLTTSCAHTPSPRPDASPSPEPTPSPPQIAATVDEVTISMGELEERLRADRGLSMEVEGLNEEMVYRAKRVVLEKMIAEILLQKEAQRKDIPSDELLEDISRGVSVSDNDVETSYRIAKNYKGGHPMLERRVERLLSGSEEEIRERLREFIRQERIWVSIYNYVRPLREKADIKIYLQKP